MTEDLENDILTKNLLLICTHNINVYINMSN